MERLLAWRGICSIRGVRHDFKSRTRQLLACSCRLHGHAYPAARHFWCRENAPGDACLKDTVWGP